ncbi:glycosyltransferase family 2 protein [Ruegeria sp. R13_0]|uniref:glycosyltransferase family 2 protein n=1 Tax=Ruegeria sp. R13_0 TaxID=2821099 RepID=UPI001ADCAA08|nr:glycosyltransferase family 2 protein [Ruegeria sp. R13_0]MBO9436772.1 glycosyltransferase family 2 protein [Ruegeria sp. R13_0]
MLSVVIPVYKNEANIPHLLEELTALYNKSFETGELEVVFVVDGSPDNSLLALRMGLPNVGFRSQLLCLSRNFGAFAAIRAGLQVAKGDYIAVMAADLQEPPELVVDMYRGMQIDDIDVAYGARIARNDPWQSKVLSQGFWSIYRRFVAKDIPEGGVDVFAVTAKVRDQILMLNERNSSLIVLLFWMGFKRKGFEYERRAREVGKSAWTFNKKWRYMQDSVFSFSDLPISFLITIGFFGFVLSGLLALVVLVSSLLGKIEVPGYAATILVILFLGMLQIFSLGILGVYLWRVFENTKGRPLHIVMSSEEFGEELDDQVFSTSAGAG